MKKSCGQVSCCPAGERGSSRLKFILVLAIIAIVGYVAFQYVPVAYQASRFKVAMQDNVDKASTLGQSSEWLRNQLRVDANEYGVPADAEITIERGADGRAQARVQYTRQINFPGYTYLYKFDHTARSTELLGNKQ